MVGVNIPADEDLEDLQLKGYTILQKKTGFRFGIDSVLLSDFINESGGKMLDLCTGSGIVPILAYAKEKADYVEGLEIVDSIADMANRSMEINRISDRIYIRNGNLCHIEEIYKAQEFDFVSCNPPYIKSNSGQTSPDNLKALARHEINCSIDDVAAAVSYCLKPKGSFYLIHRAYRLVDIFAALTKYKLEPKRMKLVSSSVDKPPVMVLLEAVKGGKRQLNIGPNIIV